MKEYNPNKMKMVPATCPQCGGTLEVDTTRESAYCQFCGTPFIIDDAIDTYNVNHATINNVESMNIVKKGAVESVLGFVSNQQKRKDDKIREKEEKERLEKERNIRLFKKYWWAILIALVAIFILPFVGSGSDSEKEVEKLTISMTHDSTYYEGENYKEMIIDLERVGFTNIQTEALDDLITGWLTKDGEVESIEIDGKNVFGSGTEFLPDSEVVITYHTFSSEEDNEQAESKEKTEKDGSEEKIETEASAVENEESGTRNISGFNAETNQILAWCGIEFTFPGYYDVLDANSNDVFMMYYPEQEDYYSSLLFQSQGYTGTQKEFTSKVPTIIENTFESGRFANAELSDLESINIAGLPGWTISYTISDDKNGETITSGNYSMVYNERQGKIAMLNCLYDIVDQSNYDYMGDFVKVLGAAKLLTNQSEEVSSQPEIITIDNNSEFSTLMVVEDPEDPYIEAFASKYKGKKVEFDGCVVLLMNHDNYDTRFDLLIYGGNYDDKRTYLAAFTFIDVNFYDMKVSGAKSVAEKMNFKITGTIKGFSDEGNYIELDPISMVYRD